MASPPTTMAKSVTRPSTPKHESISNCSSLSSALNEAVWDFAEEVLQKCLLGIVKAVMVGKA